jgi:hypothetical protein
MYGSDRRMAREALFEAIENQMKGGDPPETKETYDRLRASGYSRQETMKLLACVLLDELNEMVRDKRTYNAASYVRKLKALPQLPWEYDPDV